MFHTINAKQSLHTNLVENGPVVSEKFKESLTFSYKVNGHGQKMTMTLNTHIPS